MAKDVFAPSLKKADLVIQISFSFCYVIAHTSALEMTTLSNVLITDNSTYYQNKLSVIKKFDNCHF